MMASGESVVRAEPNGLGLSIRLCRLGCAAARPFRSLNAPSVIVKPVALVLRNTPVIISQLISPLAPPSIRKSPVVSCVAMVDVLLEDAESNVDPRGLAMDRELLFTRHRASEGEPHSCGLFLTSYNVH